MKNTFSSLDLQQQLHQLASSEMQLDEARTLSNHAQDVLSFDETRIAWDISVNGIDNIAANKKATLESLDPDRQTLINQVAALISAEITVSDAHNELLVNARSSEFEEVRQIGWARIDKAIEDIQTGRFKGPYLQNILFAASVGPFSSSKEPNDMRIVLQTGDYEHYNLPELLDGNGLIKSSQIYGEFGERRSILTTKGEDVLERLTEKLGAPTWASKVEASHDVSDDHDGVGEIK